MHILPPEGVTAEKLIERIVNLAYDASQVVGMGVFQERLNRPDDKIIFDQANHLDRDGVRSFAYDYVFGRMMKLHIDLLPDGAGIALDDWPPRPDYQSWCRTYPTYAALVEAAVKSLKDENAFSDKA